MSAASPRRHGSRSPTAMPTWPAIDAFGREISAELAADDVRLTIGGEPTFVASEDPDAAEWNTAATGPTKRRLCGRADRALARAFRAAGAAALRPGQVVSGRAACRAGPCPCIGAATVSRCGRTRGRWRTRPAITRRGPSRRKRSSPASRARLELAADAVLPAYEDPWHFLAQERKLPENLDAASNRLDDPLARARLARVFERGLDQPAGFVLPLQRWNAKDGSRRWASETWNTRAGRLFLVPGDSPVGFRLPLPLVALSRAARVSLHRARRSVRGARGAAPSRPVSASPSCAARKTANAAQQVVEPARARAAIVLRAPHSRPSRATASSACSCRPSPSSRTTSIWSRQSRTRARSSRCPYGSKATSRRRTRASTSSR